MKNNILNRFAINDLKIHKRDSLITLITIFIISMTVMLISFLTPLMTNGRFLEYQHENGNYTYYDDIYIEHVREPVNLKQAKYIVDGKEKTSDDFITCIKYNCGRTLHREDMYEIEGDCSICATRLIEGRMPKNKNEITLKKDVLRRWSYEEKIGNQIKLSYTDYQDQVVVKEFEVVGLLEETGRNSIIVSGLSHDHQYESFYIKTNADETIDNAQQLSLTNNVTIDAFSNAISNAAIATLIQALIIIIAGALMYGLTMSSFEKKQKDYTLLRSIGTTQRQMYYVILIQSLVLSIIPLGITILLIYILSKILPLVIVLPLGLPFSIGDILWNAFLVLCIVFMSYFIPARSVTRRALSGTFEGQEFQYFYYRYKKLHQMRPFYLAWRQLVSVKKKMIMKVILIMIITVTSMRIIGYASLDNQWNEKIQNESLDDITIKCTMDERLSQKEMSKDFQNLKPYIQSMVSYNYISSETLYDQYIEKMALDESYNSLPSLYCINQQIKEVYDLPDIQKGQIIVTNAFLNTKGIDENQTLSLMGSEYHIVQVLDDDNESAYLNESDYQKYQRNTNESGYSKIILSFDSVQEKTNVLLNHAKDIAPLYDKYDVETYSIGISEEVQDESISEGTIQRLLIMSAVAVIYIYQFIFELLKQKEDIGSYQLLGLTSQEIGQIYFYKSLIAVAIGFIGGVIYYILDMYYKYQSFLQESYVLSFEALMPTILFGFVIVMIVLMISLLPLRNIVKKDAFENKNTRE